MEERGDIPPGLPRDNPTESYWQESPDSAADLRSTDHLPSSADYVIIGSGVSGCFIAYNTLSRLPEAKVVMLEARKACSGATGRNGGHTKGASYRAFLSHVQKHGLEEAIRIAALEQRNRNAMHAFARDNDISCDSNPCQTVDVTYSQTQWDMAMRSIKYMRRHVPRDTTEQYQILSQEETAKKYLCPGAIGAIEYEAGSVHSYNFAVGVLKLGLKMGLNLQTNTPATALRQQHGSRIWNVETPRGTISSSSVIIATNGYTAHLLPSMQGTIVPLRGQMSSQRPGKGLPTSGLPGTYSFIYDGCYEYMIPRPQGSKDAGNILIGGGWGTLPCGGAQEFGVTDDTTINKTISEYLAGSTKQYYGTNWGQDAPEGQIHKEWTGIMGTSADGNPYIGEHPSYPGIYLSASFNGHGMVQCQQCAIALTTSMLGTEQEKSKLDDWFPHSWWLTEKRLKVEFNGRRDVEVPGKIEGEDELEDFETTTKENGTF